MLKFYKWHTTIKIKKLLAILISLILLFTSLDDSLRLNNAQNLFYNQHQLAYATELSDAKTEFQNAQQQLASLQNEYRQEIDKAAIVKNEINTCTANALNAQKEKFKHQSLINQLAVSEYKESYSLMFVNLLFQSNNVFDFLKNLYYSNKIMRDRAEAINQQELACKEYQNSIDALNSKLEQYNQISNTLNEKLSAAQQLVNEASQKVKSAEDKQKLQQQAQNIPQPGGSGGGDTPSTEWKNGSASAYGGSSDPGAGTHTATGDLITESSTGVAVPISLPNYKSLFGHAIQIKYNGQTVIGVINDTGGFGSSGRDLDLQPGIFHAFGAGSCQAWGVRTVEYIIL